MRKEIIDELTTRLIEKDILIKILKTANAEKDILINTQGKELVFLNHQIAELDKFY